MKLFLVELREIYTCGCEASPHWEITTMHVASNLLKALQYCKENVAELENGSHRHSWYAVCEHTLDLDNPVDGFIVGIYGINGPMENQPVDGYK